MIYRLINGEQVLAKVITMFNIDNSDWIAKSSQWLLDGLSDMRITANTETYSRTVEIVDRKAKLPCDIKSLVDVEYNNERITRENITTGIKDDVLTYQLLHNNYILLNQDYFYPDESVTFYFKSLPITLSKLYNVYLPEVPDNFDVIQALAYYVLTQYLMHGYKHTIFDLNSNNSFTNPAIIYYGLDRKSGLRLVARNSINSLDAHAMENLQDRAASLNTNPEARRIRTFKTQ